MGDVIIVRLVHASKFRQWPFPGIDPFLEYVSWLVYVNKFRQWQPRSIDPFLESVSVGENKPRAT